METNEITGKCIHLGHLLLHGGESKALRKELSTCISDKIIAELHEGSQIILKRAMEAHRFLVSDKMLHLIPSDSEIGGITAGEITDDVPVGIQTATAMRNLDTLGYLERALESLYLEDSELYTACLAVSEEIWENELYHRLIPMNAYRAKMLERILENARFFFPWYETWVEQDPLTWHHYENHMAGEGDYTGDTVLNEEVLNDEPFYNRLVERATLIKELPQIIAEDHVYHLFKEVDAIIGATELPDIVVKAGRVDAAVRVAVEDIRNGVPSEKWRVEAALFGMGLTEVEREQILRPIFEDGREDMDTVRLTECLTTMVRRLEEVSVRGFRGLNDPHKTLIHLLLCKYPDSLATAVKAWDQM